jgi:hypothetical protein
LLVWAIQYQVQGVSYRRANQIAPQRISVVEGFRVKNIYHEKRASR